MNTFKINLGINYVMSEEALILEDIILYDTVVDLLSFLYVFVSSFFD